MPPPAALLLTATFGSAPARLSLSLTPRPQLLRSPRRAPAARIRPARIRAATAVGGEFGGLGRRREFIGRLRNVLPGGRWWRLEDEEEDAGGRAEASGATAASALQRMWALVAADRWVVFLGFASLVCAAVMPLVRLGGLDKFCLVGVAHWR
jgi:ATP-binding cassette subfamily B (MDR/TAP) protein 9